MLTHEQEIIYGKQVQQMMALHDQKAALAQTLEHEPTAKELAEHAQMSEVDLKRGDATWSTCQAKNDRGRTCVWWCRSPKSIKSVTWSSLT